MRALYLKNFFAAGHFMSLSLLLGQLFPLNVMASVHYTVYKQLLTCILFMCCLSWCWSWHSSYADVYLHFCTTYFCILCCWIVGCHSISLQYVHVIWRTGILTIQSKCKPQIDQKCLSSQCEKDGINRLYLCLQGIQCDHGLVAGAQLVGVSHTAWWFKPELHLYSLKPPRKCWWLLYTPACRSENSYYHCEVFPFTYVLLCISKYDFSFLSTLGHFQNILCPLWAIMWNQ